MSLLYALERGTSPIDWCEFNYTHSPFIAEIINTVKTFLNTTVLQNLSLSQHILIPDFIFTDLQYLISGLPAHFDATLQTICK